MKINFIISHPFNSSLDLLGQNSAKKDNQDSTKDKRLLDSKKFLEKKWLVYEKKIIKSIEKVSGYKFKNKVINCYVNNYLTISSPLCININYENKTILHNLIHELIHNLFMDNIINKGFRLKWEYYWKSLDYPRLIKSHILLHAIHIEVCRQIFPKDEKRVWYDSSDINYTRSRDMVKKIGSKKIIELFNKKIKLFN